jgi:hypothetical protein
MAETDKLKDLPDFDGCYKVSKDGTVYSLKSGEIKALKGGSVRHGYKGVTLYHNGKAYLRLVHRAVAEAFLPNPNKLPHVNHKDFDKENNCVDNLEWCNISDNVRHTIRKGKHSRCLASEAVLEIRRRHAAGESQASLAKQFGRSPGTICQIVNNQTFTFL